MNPFEQYHREFNGDTFETCVKCGGRCEQTKIATLLPGEKEYMAETLGISIETLDRDYLDQIDTFFGPVDVLRLTGEGGCKFLNERFECTAKPAKPVLCDIYPLIFKLEEGGIQFVIDKDCPMSLPEYAARIAKFESAAVLAMRHFRIPLGWLRAVELFDPFDFDYARIDKELKKRLGQTTYALDDVLAFKLAPK